MPTVNAIMGYEYDTELSAKAQTGWLPGNRQPIRFSHALVVFLRTKVLLRIASNQHSREAFCISYPVHHSIKYLCSHARRWRMTPGYRTGVRRPVKLCQIYYKVNSPVAGSADARKQKTSGANRSASLAGHPSGIQHLRVGYEATATDRRRTPGCDWSRVGPERAYSLCSLPPAYSRTEYNQ